MKRITEIKLKEIIRKHSLWLKGKRGGIMGHLNNLDLREFDFSKRKLNLIDFSDSNLRCVNFERSDLTGVDFRGSDLTGASFVGSYLIGANFAGANISGADIDYSCWPLWCGSIGVKIDDEIQAQLLYHAFINGNIKPTKKQVVFIKKNFKRYSKLTPLFS